MYKYTGTARHKLNRTKPIVTIVVFVESRDEAYSKGKNLLGTQSTKADWELSWTSIEEVWDDDLA